MDNKVLNIAPEAQQLRILIVDDEYIVRTSLRVALETLNCIVSELEDGSSIFEAINAFRPDIILLDVMMPTRSGYEVCRELRNNSKTQDILIVLLTGLDSKEARLEGFKSGADDFLIKPVDRSELAIRFHSLVKQANYRRAAAQHHSLEYVLEMLNIPFLVTDSSDFIIQANSIAKDIFRISDAVPGLKMDLTALLSRSGFDVLNGGNSWVRRETEYLQSKIYDILRIKTADEQSNIIIAVDQTQLLKAERVAEAVISTISHKLKTPLNILSMSVDIIGDDVKNCQQLEFLTYCRKAISELNQLIQRGLEYAEAPIIGIGNERLALEEINSCVNEASQMAGVKIDTISISIINNLAELVISKRALILVLQECFLNCQKFHPKHTPKIDITICESGDEVSLVVADDGQGIDPDVCKFVGMPFFQIEKYQTGQVRGWGLGFGLIWQYIILSGGRFHIRNRSKGAGSEISFRLPIGKT